MILTATINEVKRRVTFDNPNAVVAVKGDYEVNGVAFAFPAIYEDDFDLSTAVKTVYYKATDGIIYNHVVTDTDTDTGYPLWVFKDEINKGAYGDVEFALVCDKVEGGNIVKRWVSMITAFRVQKSIEIDEAEQEDNEQTYSERLAYLMTQMANMQATVSGLASGAPTPVSLASAMTDTSKLYVYTGSESGYTAGHWYYYNGSAWADGGQYGGISVDTTLTVSGAAADAKVTGDKIEEIKEDLSVITGNERIELKTGGYIRLSDATADILNPTASDVYSYAVVSCSEGDKFTINASGRATAKPWGFLSNDGTVLSTAKADSSSTDTVVSNALIIAPANTAYLVINNRGAGVSYKGTMLADEVSKISRELASLVGIKDSVKNALLSCLSKVAWIDDSGQSCYDALEAAFSGTPITPSPIYSLSNYDYNNYPPSSDNIIGTGISLFSLEKGWTITCDLTTTTAQQGAWRLFSSLETVPPYRGFYYGSHGNTNQAMIANTAFKWESTTRSAGSTTVVTGETALGLTDFDIDFVGRHKCVFVYNPQTGFKAFFKDNDGDVKTFSTSEIYSKTYTTQVLRIGGAGQIYGLVGHINMLNVWDYPLTSSEVTDFMARD